MITKTKSPTLFPKNIKLASKRRKFTQTLLVQRTGLSRVTVRKIVNGDPTVAIRYYIMVLGILGLAQSEKTTELGRKLQDIEVLRK